GTLHRLLPLHFLLPGTPPSPPFPYTTLFRSKSGICSSFTFCRSSWLVSFRSRSCSKSVRSSESESPSRADSDDLTDFEHDLERRSEEHTSELQSRENLVCRLLLEKKKQHIHY